MIYHSVRIEKEKEREREVSRMRKGKINTFNNGRGLARERKREDKAYQDNTVSNEKSNSPKLKQLRGPSLSVCNGRLNPTPVVSFSAHRVSVRYIRRCLSRKLFIAFGVGVMQDHRNFSLLHVRRYGTYVNAIACARVHRYFPRAAHYTVILRGNTLPPRQFSL